MQSCTLVKHLNFGGGSGQMFNLITSLINYSSFLYNLRAVKGFRVSIYPGSWFYFDKLN